MERGLQKQFAKKQKVFELNFGAVKAGFDYAQTTFIKQDPFVIEPMNETKGKIIIDGNAACGMGAVFRRRNGNCLVSHHAFDLAG